MKSISEEQWIDWVDALANDDYVVIDNFLNDEVYSQLRSFFLTKLGHDEFDPAGIGALADHHLDQSRRGDHVYWLDSKVDEHLSPVFELIHDLIGKLNRYCYLGIADFESHLAYYPVGTFYEKHVDQFKARSNRLISMIIYLNEGWKAGDGGELKLFFENEEKLVEPIAKRIVLFKSDVLPHEVLKTNVGRYSLTGWLLKNPADLGFLLG
ncbi:MAG: 2OG-Fe(II) oxygenase [Cytophagia bacterium]|nr:2OG-Fe(II) oxygenase [Cytophagia bacterium]